MDSFCAGSLLLRVNSHPITIRIIVKVGRIKSVKRIGRAGWSQYIATTLAIMSAQVRAFAGMIRIYRTAATLNTAIAKRSKVNDQLPY